MRDLAAYRFWGYAATFGALWGALELTAGSFLHALKVPLSGVVLAGMATILLVSLRAMLPVRGVVLSAGLVCAGVKMLSPAGAVIGPMAAILAESALVELALLTGTSALSGAVAGALSCLWAIAQNLITQVLFFGVPVMGLYRAIAQQAERVVHLPSSGGAWAAATFVAMVALIGVSFGIAGAMVGWSTSRQLAAGRT